MKVAVSWSGGKDSCLACHRALAKGFDVAFIVTFLWENPIFWHPLSLISLQSEALEIRHVTANVKEPYFEEYREAIYRFIKEDQIEGIVTGDVSFVDSSQRNWIDDVCTGLDIKVIKPLWNGDRCEILNELISNGFKAVFTCVKQPWFDEKWLGRELNWETLKELEELKDKHGIDLCGEMGEYHTMIIDGPIFKKAIQITEFTLEKKASAYFMKPTRFFLRPKTKGI